MIEKDKKIELIKDNFNEEKRKMSAEIMDLKAHNDKLQKDLKNALKAKQEADE